MTTEISRLPLVEPKHWLGVLAQMGRVQLDSDWNEQAELWLRLLQGQARDTVRDGSPNQGFRVDDRILLDAMDERAPWRAAGPDPRVFVDFFDHRTGVGSLVASGAIAVARPLGRATDFAELREVVVAARGAFAAGALEFFLGAGGVRWPWPLAEDAAAVEGWRVFRAARPAGAVPIDPSAVDEYGFGGMVAGERYAFDFLKADLPILQPLVSTTRAGDFAAIAQNPGDAPELGISDDDRFWRSAVVEVTQAGAVEHVFPAPRDLRHARRLVLAVRTGGGGAPAFQVAVTDVAAATVVLAAPHVSAAGAWEVRAYDLPQAGVDWSRVRALRWQGLDPGTLYRLAPVRLEMALAGNLVIMGGDGTAEGAGRFYGGGLAAVKERHETYFSQRDLPLADPAPLQPPADGKCRRDLAYLDLWERPVTYLEDPGIREIALEGPDTTTRTQLVAQVRVLRGDEVNAGDQAPLPEAAFAALPRRGGGTLTTKDSPEAVLDPCADPCEPGVAGTFLGEENRLFRVEVHAAGDVGAAGAAGTAQLKWSRENGAAASALDLAAAAGDHSVRVERPGTFAVGDLVEIADDLADLVTGPFTDRRQTRGELRQITAIDSDGRVVSWEDAGAPGGVHAGLGRDYALEYHPKLRRWDGVLPATPGDVVLDDGVVIELGGAGFLPGDYWVFATRVADRSVERLVDEPARGVEHRFFRLASVLRCADAGAGSVAVDDLRPAFHPLTGLRATDVAFDPGACLDRHAEWAQVGNVQEAIDAICRMDLAADLRLHHRLLHGPGVVCGLKVRCDFQNREQVIVNQGYALDCEGYTIEVGGDRAFAVVQAATQGGFLDENGDGEVCLTLARGLLQDAALAVEAHETGSFLDEVLEGTLLLDFYRGCIEGLLKFLMDSFLPLATTEIPVPERYRLLVALIGNVVAPAIINPASGQYIFLSVEEDDLMRRFYNDLKARLQSQTFCAMFDHARPFPDYPYDDPPGIATAFGLPDDHLHVRVNPQRPFAYTFGPSNVIFVFDTNTNELVERVVFPGGSNLEVQDLAFSADGARVFAVGLIADQDSVFATATLGAGPVHAWGPTTVVCDHKFVRLGTRPGDNNLYALARARGLFRFDPAAIPLQPAAGDRVGPEFNATGVFAVSADGARAAAAEDEFTAVGTDSSSFTRLRIVDFANPAAPVFAAVTGTDENNDVAVTADMVFATGDAAPGQVKTLYTFDRATGAQIDTTDLGEHTLNRLLVLPASGVILVVMNDSFRVVRVDLDDRTLDPLYRIPVQVFPTGIAASPDGETVYVLNWEGVTTLSVIDVDPVLDPAPTPLFTAEPPVSLADYHQAIIDAYTDLLKGLAQYLKDCFCDRFLVDCPRCGPDDKVYLGCVEIRGGQVYHICNFSKRHYAKSFRTYGYWLSAIPILPLVKKAFAELCCLVFDPDALP